MTNLQMLGTLTDPDDAYRVVRWLWKDYGSRWTDQRLAIMDWFLQEYREDEWYHMFDFPFWDFQGNLLWTPKESRLKMFKNLP